GTAPHAADDSRRPQPPLEHSRRRCGQRDGGGARSRARGQRLRHRRRSSGQLQRNRREPRRRGARAASVRRAGMAAAAADAVPDAHDHASPAAVEREGARRARVAPRVPDDSRRPGTDAGARRIAMAEIDLFQAQRPRLFAVAYRMLGSASDAEDVVQDAWLRYAGARPAEIKSPEAYLTTIVT